jgi:peptide/nickel transport system ATP-binding protein
VRPLLEIANVSQEFEAPTGRLLGRPQRLRAVADVSLAIAAGRSVGLVGESGCGKSTLARIAAGFIRPSMGEVRLEGKPLLGPNGRPAAGRRVVQMVFQDPLAALDARMSIGAQLEEVLVAVGRGKAEAGRERDRLLEAVGLGRRFAARYPHEISGGQRQRAVIARALAAEPKLLICDEALAALDVSVQAQMLALFSQLKAEFGLSLLFISHQLSTVRYLCDEVAVMYAGRIVEQGPAAELFAAARHPYTRMLLASALHPGGASRYKEPVIGDPPNPLALPPGCPFHPRCASRSERCEAERPALASRAERLVACHLA